MQVEVTILDSYKFVREEIKHEYNVLGNRMNSYITSQSFLVSAFAVAMNHGSKAWGAEWRLYFPIIVCVTGMVLSWRAQPGIQSCVKILNSLHDRQSQMSNDPAVKTLDPTDPQFMIEVHRQSLEFSILTAYVFGSAWLAMLGLAVYLYISRG